MCGIAGVARTSRIQNEDVETVRGMNRILAHRGPDDEGIFSDESCVLGHRRLSIIDLSKDGHQPLTSADGRYHLVYNGELYNYIELRDELIAAGVSFQTKTDTEVLLKTYLHYGEDCLNKFNGMFAFVIYDQKEKSLFLARDRFGIKPLYYTQQKDTFYFASEIKALRSIDGTSFSVNNQAVFDYLVFNRTDIFEETFLNEVKRIPKAHKAHWQNGCLDIKPWWNPSDYLNQNLGVGFDEAARRIDELLVSSTTLRMRSDVTVGSCVSGGLDSSILTGILFKTQQADRNFKTFTATCAEDPLDESGYVDQLNQVYPFTNFRISLDAKDTFDHLDEFVYANDEPTMHSSYYAQYSVMRRAKEEGVTVLLDGQGGDETFAGYPYFLGFYLYGLWKKKALPRLAKTAFDIFFAKQDRLIFQTFLFQLLPDALKKKALYKTVSYMDKTFFDRHLESSRVYHEFFSADNLNVSMVRHFQYKLEHLLRMEDRNSMAFSIEARLPYLDYRLVEYLLSISEDFKVKAGHIKHLQKKAVGHYSIESIVGRNDKVGFNTPQQMWLKTHFWQKRIEESHSENIKQFTGLFNKNISTAPSAVQWKMVQLATWNNVNQKHKAQPCAV